MKGEDKVSNDCLQDLRDDSFSHAQPCSVHKDAMNSSTVVPVRDHSRVLALSLGTRLLLTVF